MVFTIGINNLKILGVGSEWHRGFLGDINPNAIFTTTTFYGNNPGTIFVAIVIANAPQLLFSFSYFLYNGILTSMMASYEWTNFAAHRKALRVSEPERGQRSTYWLQLPWSYSLPLLAVSTIMYILVSRSIFFVKIDVWSFDRTLDPNRTISACGYSPLAILLVMILLVLMLFTLIALGLRRLPPGIPDAGTCSAAISAACHQGSDDPDAVYKPLKWGVVQLAGDDFPGHCCLTSLEVQEPRDGKFYL